MLANVQQASIKPIIEASVSPGSLIHTDEYDIYARLAVWGYRTPRRTQPPGARQADNR